VVELINGRCELEVLIHKTLQQITQKTNSCSLSNTVEHKIVSTDISITDSDRVHYFNNNTSD